jgi:glucose/arabinose dehydrogenase
MMDFSNSTPVPSPNRLNIRLLQAVLLTFIASTACQSQGEAVGRAKPFSTTEIAQFDTPWAIDFLPGSGVRLTKLALVSEKDGRLWLVDTSSGARAQVSGVPAVHVAGQGGLGDVVVHPDFAGNRRVYLSYVEAGDGGTSGAVLGYGTLDLRDMASPVLRDFRVVWKQRPKVSGNGHFSHRVAFGPDGFLYLTSGDRQKFDPAQAFSGNLGKVLRLTAEGQPAPGNPWAARGGVAAQFWTMGHRNLLGIAFAPDGRLWETEMGPRGGDELNLVVAGRNYGWPRASNGSHYSGQDIPDHKPGDGFEPPKAWWNPSISPGGLMIYTGDKFPAWKGDAIIPALSGEALIRVDIEGDRARKADEWPMGERIRAAEQGPEGSIYLLEDEGRLLRLDPVPSKGNQSAG